MLSMLFAPLALGFVTTTNGEGDREWSSLDHELSTLSAALQAPESGVTWDGYLRVFVAQESDSPAFAGGANDDVLGVGLDRARLGLSGAIGKYSMRVQMEAAGGDARLLDAYGAWNCNEYFRTTLGRFQTPLYWNALVEPRNQLFVLRTTPDEFWIGGQPAQLADDIGVMLDGAFERLHWWLAVQNGVDGIGNELATTVRLRYDVLGKGVGMIEGAYGAPEEAAFSVDVGWRDDGGAVDGGGNSADGDCLAIGAQYANGRWAANAEFLDFASGSVNVFDTPDSQPWAATLSYMLEPNKWELAARYEDADTASNLSAITLGANYYVVGHDVKWQLNVVSTMSDNNVEEATALALGLTVGK
jgi:hypothetical protein